MPNSSTNTSKHLILSDESTASKNIIVENFPNLQDFIQISSEGLPADRIFILFTSKQDIQTEEGIVSRCKQAEKTIQEYFKCIPDSERQDVKLIYCRIKEEELHLVSLSKIYPWCILENIKYLPTVLRLDGMRYLYGNDVCDFMKLELLFKSEKHFKKYPIDFSNNIEPKPRSLILNLKHGDCSFHGKVIKHVPEKQYKSESEEEEEEIENSAIYSNDRLGKILYIRKRTFQVQRQPVDIPVVELPPEEKKEVKKRKPKKKKKGKRKGKKGKGKKGKGKKGKGKK